MSLRVCCICLTADRSQLLARAISSFDMQTYAHKKLLVYDTGEEHEADTTVGYNYQHRFHIFSGGGFKNRLTIGTLRNHAIQAAQEHGPVPDAIAHFDDDDWSHPDRLAMQVKTLEAGAEVTGVGSMIVWNSTVKPGVAWEYASVHADKKYCVGASLCYKISAWQREKFPDRQVGEDKYWGPAQNAVRTEPYAPDGMPLLVAEIHGSNTALHKSFESRIVPGVQGWTRRRDMDELIAEVMKL